VVEIPQESAELPKGLLQLRTKKIVIRDSSGNPSILLGITEDITEKIERENNLRNIQLQLSHSAKLASLGEISAGVAHEINNPLSIIFGSLNVMQRLENNPEKLHEKIAVVKKSCERISRIVRGLQKFSRSSTSVEFTSKVLSEIVQESVGLTEMKSRQCDTIVTFESKSQSNIFCDQVEIEQVLINLISNAIDAVKSLDEKWVKVELLDEDDQVVLRVIDSGPGIPEDICNNLFTPFFTTKEIGEGTGLGLSITKGILDQHNATVKVLTRQSHTCFEIRFNKVQESIAALG
jgi:C4-dicarboxylate-specific signal transduction histidine kinase